MKGRRSGIVITAVGAVLAIVAIIWMTAIFPGMLKLPEDLDETVHYVGTLKKLDPNTFQMNEFPISITRHEKAAGLRDGILLVDEDICIVNSDTGEEIERVKKRFAVDRVTCENVSECPDADKIREGLWNPSPGIKEGETILTWKAEANRALEGKCLGSEEIHGLRVLVCEAEYKGVPLGPDPNTGFELELDTYNVLKFEPRTGIIVYLKMVDSVSAILPVGKITALVSEVEFPEDTIDEMVDKAKDARSTIYWFGTYVPWIIIGIGIILFGFGIRALVRRVAS